MNEEQTLELQIQAKASESLNVVNKLVESLTKVEKNVSKISNKLNNVNTNNAKQQMNNFGNSVDKATKSLKLFKSALTFSGVRHLANVGLSWLNEAIDKSEQLNLFNVVFKNMEKNGVQTFSTLGREATKFQNKLNEAFGTNQTETLYMQGIFQSMGESTGINSKYSAIMSETMTKLSYDLASLFNRQESDVAEALRAGVYAGQTKPLTI